MLADRLVYIGWRINEDEVDTAGNVDHNEWGIRNSIAGFCSMWWVVFCSCFTIPIAAKLLPGADSDYTDLVTVGITLLLVGGGVYRYLARRYSDQRIREIGRSEKYKLSVTASKWLFFVFVLFWLVSFLVLIFLLIGIACHF